MSHDNRMPKHKKGFTTLHIRVLGSCHRKNIPSDRNQQARHRLQCSYFDSFHEEFKGEIFLSVEPDAKLDMLNNFDLKKLFDLY